MSIISFRSRGYRVLAVLAIATGLIAGLLTTRDTWLPTFAGLLVVNDRLEKADVIVVLSAGSPWRNKKAALLYHQGLAAKIITLGNSYNDHLLPALGKSITDAELNAEIVFRSGVPLRDIVALQEKTAGTYGEALLLKKYIDEKQSIDSMILVTSGFHSRRAKWIFHKVLRQNRVRIIAVEAEIPHFSTQNWWHSEHGVLALFNEYLKFAYYWINYRS